MIHRIRTRLLLVNVLIVAVPLIGLGFARFYEREMLRAHEDDLIHQARLLAAMIAADPRGPRLAERQAVLARVARDSRTRLRLVDRNGRVVADSAGAGAEPVAGRREIRAALAARYGAATRVIEERGVTVLYSALPIVAGGEVLGAVYGSRSTAPVQAAMWRLRRSIFTVLGVAVAATAVLSLFLAATVSRPLGRLAAAARRMAAGDRRAGTGGRREYVPGRLVSRRDEIGELAGAVDDMARQLEARAEETAELAANVCHELKSPLTGLRGAAELLAGGEVTDPVDRRRFLDNIVADVDRLDALVTRLLELSRASADGEPWELVDLREPVAAGARLAAVDLELGPRPIPVRGRPGHLASAVRNLVENALVHREPGSRVAVALAARRGVAAVEVINRGSPIPAAIAAKIWGRFYTTRGADGGTGLGLPIVAAVARAHGGEARLASSTAGATTFAIELPIATPLSRSR